MLFCQGELRLFFIFYVIYSNFTLTIYPKEKHTIIRTKDNTYEIHIHLKKIENKLPPEKFFRCQRRYIAGFAHIERHTNTEITFDNGERAQIGKAYSAKFKKAFQEYVMRYNERIL